MNGNNAQVTGQILIVDDTLPNLRLLSGILRASGYETLEADTGELALQIARVRHPDLILLDIMMPGLDGYEVCEHLKADEATFDIPVVFISALNDTEGIVKAFSIGGVDYITKPFQPREVMARVANHLTLVRQRKQIEAMREQDRQRYETLSTLKNQFIQNATHDLKNPLNVIMGYAALLAEFGATEPPAFTQDAAANIQASVEKMRQLVTDMLDLAQIETGVNLVVQPIAFARFLDIALRGFPMLAQQKQIDLVVNLPPDDLLVPLAASRMERAIANLVSNAIKYTPIGGLVEVSGYAEEDCAIIKVQDTGLGIPADDLPNLFQAFYRVEDDAHHQIEGTGLGLAVVKSVVDQHHGQIFVESEPGQGSTFCVTLPLQAAEHVSPN